MKGKEEKRKKKINNKRERGITLIALVITIIILLILAGVTIGLVTGDNGLLAQAIKAKEETEMSKEKENLKLAVLGAILKEENISRKNLETELNSYIGKQGQDYELLGDCPFIVKYKSSGRSYFIDEVGNIKEYVDIAKYVNVGDYVNYNPTISDKYGTPVNSSKLTYISYHGTAAESGNGYREQKFSATSDIKWKIFNIENGVIELISETPIYATQDNTGFIMSNAIGYLYAEEELSKVCSIFGYGYGANTNLDTVFKYGGPLDEKERKINNTGARSITVEDLNKKAGISEADIKSLDVKYGNIINLEEKVFYPTITTSIGDEITGKSNSADLASIKYSSYKYNKSKITDEEVKNLLFNGNYWLASRCLNNSNDTNIHTNYFNVRVVTNKGLDACNLCYGTNSNLYENTYYIYAIRPIVTLKYDVIDTNTNYEKEGHWNLK